MFGISVAALTLAPKLICWLWSGDEWLLVKADALRAQLLASDDPHTQNIKSHSRAKKLRRGIDGYQTEFFDLYKRRADAQKQIDELCTRATEFKPALAETNAAIAALAPSILSAVSLGPMPYLQA